MAETKVFGVTINTDQLKNIPDTYKIIAGSVLGGLILFGAAFYLVYPVYQEYQVLLEENEKLSQENEDAERKLGYNPNSKKYRKIEDTKQQIAALNEEIKVVQVRIPKDENLASLIYDLETIFEDKNKSDLFSITPAPMQAVKLPSNLKSPPGLSLKQIPLNLSVQSDYPKLINLFKDVERYQRAMGTSSLSLKPQGGDGDKFSTLSVTLSMKSFVLPEGGN